MIKTNRNKTNDPSKVIFLNKKKYSLIKTYIHLMLILILTFFNYEAISGHTDGSQLTNIGNNFSDNVIHYHDHLGSGYVALFLYSFLFGFGVNHNILQLAKKKGFITKIVYKINPDRDFFLEYDKEVKLWRKETRANQWDHQSKANWDKERDLWRKQTGADRSNFDSWEKWKRERKLGRKETGPGQQDVSPLEQSALEQSALEQSALEQSALEQSALE